MNGLTFGKITLLEFGGFKTRIMEPPELLVHPAHTNPMLMGSITRNIKSNKTYQVGDTEKATTMLFHRLAIDPKPP